MTDWGPIAHYLFLKRTGSSLYVVSHCISKLTLGPTAVYDSTCALLSRRRIRGVASTHRSPISIQYPVLHSHQACLMQDKRMIAMQMWTDVHTTDTRNVQYRTTVDDANGTMVHARFVLTVLFSI
jgi:hypothetical protein